MPSGASHTRRGLLLRGAVVVVVAGWLAWQVVASGMAAIQRGDPALALQYRPGDARALGDMAARTFAGAVESKPAVAAAKDQARAALTRDAMVVPAWRTLGAIAALEGDNGRAGALFDVAERLSRRDMPTQLWFIEERVNANDVAGALRHYDAALRTSRASRDLLLPILVSATADPAIVPPLVDVLAKSPGWRRAFIGALAEAPPAPGNAVRLVKGLNQRGPLQDQDLVAYMAQRLVASKAIDQAWELYALLTKNPQARQQTIRDGEFDDVAGIPPFDWQREAGAYIGADLGSAEAGNSGSALHVYATAGNGTVATQLLSLPPGRYALSAVAGPISGTAIPRLRWNVTCNGSGAEVGSFDVPSLTEPLRRHEMRFAVPAGDCGAQWLSLRIYGDEEGRSAEGWVDSVTINPIR